MMPSTAQARLGHILVLCHCLLMAIGMLGTRDARANVSSMLPGFTKLRFEEDYRDVPLAQQDQPFLQRIKHIPSGDDSGEYLTLGGEIRERYADTRHAEFDAANQDSQGGWLQRLVFHGDLHISEQMRIFLQLSSALASGFSGDPSPVDENRLEWQNAFVDFMADIDNAARMRLRPGRQEFLFGSGRLVDVREGPNVRRTFDALRADLMTDQAQIAGFYARPRLSRPGTFDDRRDRNILLAGLYATLPHAGPWATGTDLYYLYFQDADPTFTQPVHNERRHSVGIRWFGQKSAWDWNWEGVYQFGDYAGGDIVAWTLASETAYHWPDLVWQPRLALSANIASGDTDPNDNKLETFNALFPRGNYFSEAAVLGPRNFYNLHPSLSVEPEPDWTLTVDINFFWRLARQDGVYRPNGSLFRAPGDSRARFVGKALSLNSEWGVGRYWTLTAVYSHFVAGPFIKDTGPSADLDYVEFTARFRF